MTNVKGLIDYEVLTNVIRALYAFPFLMNI
jgi:hypothetical protein